jgi:hypothetical protein
MLFINLIKYMIVVNFNSSKNCRIIFKTMILYLLIYKLLIINKKHKNNIIFLLSFWLSFCFLISLPIYQILLYLIDFLNFLFLVLLVFIVILFYFSWLLTSLMVLIFVFICWLYLLPFCLLVYVWTFISFNRFVFFLL